jgi:hypothetical protein
MHHVPAVREPHTVFVEEDRGEAGQLLGTFSGHVRLGRDSSGRPVVGERFDRLAIDEAIAWARERCGMVLVRFGVRAQWWWAGVTPHWSYPRWPPPDLPALIERPAPTHAWRAVDFVANEPLDWAVTLLLTPDGLTARPDCERVQRWRIEVTSAAAESRACWDSQEIDRFLADAKAAGSGDSFFTLHSPVFRVHFLIEAMGRSEAVDTAQASCVPPSGFHERWNARPADLDE